MYIMKLLNVFIADIVVLKKEIWTFIYKMFMLQEGQLNAKNAMKTSNPNTFLIGILKVVMIQQDLLHVQSVSKHLISKKSANSVE